MIETGNGLDLDWKETRKSLNIPVKDDKKAYRYIKDPMFEALGKNLEKIDYQQYLTRFKWHNLPEGMDSELIERVLYFCGSAMFFYIKDLKKWFFLPYGMTSEESQIGIDFYGRFKRIKPYSFNGTSQEEKGNKKDKSTADLYLATQIRDNIIDIPMVETEEEAKNIFENGAVICFDKTPGLAYYVNSRNRDLKPYISYLIKILIQTKSALINSSGFNLFSSDTQNASELMQMEIDAINADREDGKLAAVVSKLLGNIENLQSNAPAAMADFWSSLQSVDNLRLKSLGISNDGVIQKSQYQNIQEQSMDINDSLQVYLNCFFERVKFATIVNSIWGLDIYPEPILLPQASGGNSSLENNEQSGDESQAQEGTDNA